MWYLHSLFKETSDLAYRTYLTYIYTSMAADFTINFEFITEKAGFFTITPWRGFFTTGNSIKSMVFDYAVKLMIVTKFQEIMLAFIAKALFPALFVAGIVLRTFSFSRRLGGLLLAIAISLYFIFPMFYAFGGLVMWDLKEQVRNMPGFRPDLCKEISKDACEDPPVTNVLYINGEVPMVGGSINASDALSSLDALESKSQANRIKDMEGDTAAVKPLQGPNSGDFAANVPEDQRPAMMEKARNATNIWFNKVSGKSKFDSGVFTAYQPGGPVDALARIAFFSVFFSLFGILATIAAIRSLAVTFGGDIEIAGLTHLI